MDTNTIQKLENLLLISVPRDLLDTDVLQLRRQILQKLREYNSRWVLLDFSLVDICDSFFGRFIKSTAEMAGLMGADVIVSGLQDAVVETMVDLGMTMDNIRSVLDLDDALAMSREAPGLEAKASPSDGDQSALDEEMLTDGLRPTDYLAGFARQGV
jgi:rsbT antagonist protein RsbS